MVTEECIDGKTLWVAMVFKRRLWQMPVYSISVLDTSTAALARNCCREISRIGSCDLNPRVVAGATALQ